MSPNDKPLVWLHGQIQTPPFSKEARLEAGFLLRLLQKGELPVYAAFAADAVDWAPRAFNSMTTCNDAKVPYG